MRQKKWMAGGLAILLASGTLAGMPATAHAGAGVSSQQAGYAGEQLGDPLAPPVAVEKAALETDDSLTEESTGADEKAQIPGAWLLPESADRPEYAEMAGDAPDAEDPSASGEPDIVDVMEGGQETEGTLLLAGSSGERRDDAQEIVPGQAVSDSFESVYQSKWYRFTLAQPGELSFALTHAAADMEADFCTVELSWEKMPEDATADLYRSYVTMQRLTVPMKQGKAEALPFGAAGGTWYISVRCGSGAAVAVPYELTVSCQAAAGLEQEPNNDYASATPLAVGGTVSGKIMDRSDSDYYCLSVEEESVVAFALNYTGLGEDSWRMTLYGKKESQEGYSYLNGWSTEKGKSALTSDYVALSPGVYYLQLPGIYRTDAQQEPRPVAYTLEVMPFQDGWFTVSAYKDGSYTFSNYWYEKGVRRGYRPEDPDWPGEEIYSAEDDAYYWLSNAAKGARVSEVEVYREVDADGGKKWDYVYYDANGQRAEGWIYFAGDQQAYWYEKGIRQGYDRNNAAYRGKEIYDPESEAWYWLDNVQKGAKAVSKDVYQESLAGAWGDIEGADGERYGKWVRYDAAGHMIKGWQKTDAGIYFFDYTFGTMAKGDAWIGGTQYHFNQNTGVFEYVVSRSANALLGAPSDDARIGLSGAPLELSGAGGTERDPMEMWAAAPGVVTFAGAGGTVNVAWQDGGGQAVVQKLRADGGRLSQIRLDAKGAKLGGVIQDDAGFYYAVWGTAGGSYGDITLNIAKYDGNGALIAELPIRGGDSNPYSGESWGTKIPFDAGSCRLGISDGILAVHYGRGMYNGHQSNMIVYAHTDSMIRAFVDTEQSTFSRDIYETATAYTSHSFDQRIIPLADGGFLAMNQGDAYYRGIHITRISPELETDGDVYTFHFREGSNRSYGYNETYAQAGGLAELGGVYVLAASSERILSLAPSNQDGGYLTHHDTRDMFLQFLKKDFGEYRGAERYAVEGDMRIPEGTRDRDARTELRLSGDEFNYGIVWLTAYDGGHYAANPKLVRLSDNRAAVLWEKRAIGGGVEETCYAEIDGSGHVVVDTVRLPGVRLATDDDPAVVNGVIYWATNDAGGQRLNMVRSSLAGAAENTKITDRTNGWATIDGVLYWYENGVRQGYDPENPAYRGKEIYDQASDAWYWLDNVQQGAKAVSKDVYQESLAGEWGDIEGADGKRYGKWVRYDAEGHMIKGWSRTDAGTWYFDETYGTMAKGTAVIDGQTYTFDTQTGVLLD